jgi:site-specific recombinase XerD
MDTFHHVVSHILEQESAALSRETKKTYRFVLSKFQRVFPDIACEAIDATVIRSFCVSMRQHGNSSNTISKTLAALKTLVNKARRRALFPTDPFADIRIPKINSTRQYLTTEELQSLYTHFLADRSKLARPEQDSVLAFLFSCYSGLRYSDLKSLTQSEIQNNRIRKQMHKTGDIVYIPLTAQAIALLKIARKQSDGRLLKVTENSYFNRHLRSGAKKLGFQKHIHCHLARHTFATTCLTLGIPLEVTSKLLGHRNVSTTMIYAKYVDKVLDAEMEKFRELDK